MDSTVSDFLDISAGYWHCEHPLPHSERNVSLQQATHVPQSLPEFALTRGGYCVRHADSRQQLKKACDLIRSMYAWRGYSTDSTAGLLQTPDCVTLEATADKKLFGTLTVAVDSEAGLLADALYHSEINALRGMGRRVCEFTRLAFDPKYSSKEIIASLFHLAYIYAHNLQNVTDILIEVNPRHAAFYQRRLGFQQIGEARTCARVDAPAILLAVSTDYVASQVSKHADSRDTSEKSLYPYFFSETEVQGLISRVQGAN